MKDIHIPVTIGGVTFKNPFYVASGPTTKNLKQLKRIEETGWAAASIKLSIDPAPYINRKPRYSLFKDRNALAFTAEKRLTFEEGLRLVEDAKKVLKELILMANITYAGDAGADGWVNMARKFEEAGADIIELNMCCPNMSYNLEMTSGGSAESSKKTGASMGQHADVASEIVRAIKAAIKIPLFVKLTPEGGQVAQVAKELYAAGADAVGSTGNRLGMPPINLEDPGKAFYHLQDEISMGCYSGAWLKPLAQRDTYEIRKVCGEDHHIMAAGGVTNWRDAVEMILCGADLVGICAETLISGYDIVRPMIKGLKEYMDSHGYNDLSQFRGLVVPQMKTAADITIYAGYAKITEPYLSAPCKSACPHHVPAQAYIQKVKAGKFREAFDLITEGNALQSICGLVCTHPCEDACIRGGFDTPVKIRAIKRFVLDYGRKQGWKPAWAKATSNGYKVAVVGAGPAGLSCATELVKGGYDVTVFEKESRAGGMIRYGIPDYYLDKEILDDEISMLENSGVKFVFNKALGTDYTIESLKNEYDAVFIAIGAQKRAETKEFAIDALSFVCDVNSGKKVPIGERVMVAGSDFAAVDAARIAVRLGAKQVTLLLPGTLPKTGYLKEGIAEAREEGVTIIEKAVLKAAGKGSAEILIDGKVEVSMPYDTIIVSNKYVADDSVLPGVAMTNGFVKPETGIPMVFAGGDVTRPANIITALAAGKRAAVAIDRAIRGDKATLKDIPAVKTVNAEMVRRRTGYLKRDVNYIDTNIVSVDERKKNFEPYKRVLTEEEAIKEAERCLNCGCGEGCQLCKTICCDFAPIVADTDVIFIRKEECVACGMCYNRCPNQNIEMVNLGEKV
ncbi:MAG: FAD-dependent oxidoreductase [Clostridiaceae bacterium]|nr:FAD-dependent oxidoreductase [Clostridiaceae bacterium]